MTIRLTGRPSDDLQDVLSAGVTDVKFVFVSMSARQQEGRDADYLLWHSLDHRPEQYRIAGLRHSVRLVSTPACRAARLPGDPSCEAVDHVMTYFLAADSALDKFSALSTALCGERRPFRLPSVHSGYYWLDGKIASRRAVVGADVIPWRPARGAYVLLERGSGSPAGLVDTPGVAGIWWHVGGAPPTAGFQDNTGLQLTYCFLDEDPVEVAELLRQPLERRWASGQVTPLLAAPFYTVVPFEWQRYLP
jgi:hypothetical protein